MRKFIAKTLAFSLPVIMLFLIPVVYLYASGENFRSIDETIESGKNYLIGYAYNEGNYSYLKYKELQSEHVYSVVALGSSRILQFRRKMFTTPFYNAGYTISSISDFVPFIETNLKTKKPEILLISLDQWMFNENWDNLSLYSKSNRAWKPSFRKYPTIPIIRNVWSDLFKGKFGLNVFGNSQSTRELVKMGLNSRALSTGFCKDGSIYYGSQINKLINNDSTAADYGYEDTHKRMQSGNRLFEHGTHVNEKALLVLNDFLEYCAQNNIHVVAIIPPFANEVRVNIKSYGKHTYMDSLYSKTNKHFLNYGFELWDMSDLRTYNSGDNETIDGFHGSEVSYLKMIIYMIENGSILKDYTNIKELKTDLAHKKNNYKVYDN